MTIQEKANAAEAAVVRAKAIQSLYAAENRQPTEDENTRCDAALAEYDRLMTEVAREQRTAAADAALRTTKAGMPALDSTRAAATTHNNAEDKPWRDMGEFFKAVANAGMGRSIDPRLEKRSASGANESGAPDEGGFLVGTDYETQLIQLVHDTGILAPDCNMKTISSAANSTVIYGIDETSRANGSRYGGVQSYWANEADTVTATKPKFRRIQLTLNKLFALAYATDEVLEDSTVLGQVIQQAFSEEMGFKVDDAIIRGTGSGQPLGVLNAPALVTQAKESGQTNGTIVYLNVLKMKNQMYVKGRSNAKWYVNIDAIPQLEQMYLATGTATGVPVFMPEGVTADGVARLFGRPVVPVEQCAAVGTVGDIIYADLSQYQLIEKGGVQAAQSMHVRFLYGENTFRFTYRMDGQSLWQSALTPFKGSTTVSPFVVLAAR